MQLYRYGPATLTALYLSCETVSVEPLYSVQVALRSGIAYYELSKQTLLRNMKNLRLGV